MRSRRLSSVRALRMLALLLAGSIFGRGVAIGRVPMGETTADRIVQRFEAGELTLPEVRRTLEAPETDAAVVKELCRDLGQRLSAAQLPSDADRRATERLFELLLVASECRATGQQSWRVFTHQQWGYALETVWADPDAAYEHFLAAAEALPLGYRDYARIAAKSIELALGRGDWSRARRLLVAFEQHVDHDRASPSDRVALANRWSQYFRTLGLLDAATVWNVRAQEALAALETASAHDIFVTDLFTVDLLVAREEYERLDEFVPAALARHAALPESERRPSADASLRLRWGLALVERERLGGARPRHSVPLLEAVVGDPHASQLDRFNARLSLAEVALLDGDLESFERHLPLRDELSGFDAVPRSEQLALLTLELRAARRTDRGLRDREALANELRATVIGAGRDWKRTEVRPGGYGPLQNLRPRQAIVELAQHWVETLGSPQAVEPMLGLLVELESASSLVRILDAESVAHPLEVVRRSLLREDHGAIIVVPAAEETLVIGVDRDTADVAFVAKRDRLIQLRRSWLGWLHTAPHEEPDDQARATRRTRLQESSLALAEELLPASIRVRLGSWRRVSFITFDLLGEMPWEALTFQASGTALGLTHEIDAWPSITAAQHLAARLGHSPTRRGVLVLAGPEHGVTARTLFSRLTPIRVSADDVSDWVAPYPEGARRVRVGAAATLDALGESNDDAVVQIVAHGTRAHRDAELERPARLILAPTEGTADRGDHDGIVRPEDLETLAIAPVVLVTACSTGAGPQRSGDAGVRGLAGALFTAGAGVVALPERDLYLEPIAVYSAAFHRALAAGASPAAAAREARVAVASDPRFDDPHYFAMLPLIGYGHTPVFERPALSRGALWIIVGASLGAGAALLVLLRRRRSVR